MSAPAVSTPLVRRRADLARYAIWQSRDFVMNIGIVSLVLFGMVGWLFHLNLEANAAMMQARGMTVSRSTQLAMYQEMLSMFATVAPIIAVSGIVSSDRSGGFTRFLFSKPVSPVAFYAQSLAVRFIGFLLVGFILLFAWSLFHPPQLDWKFAVDISVCFVAVAGTVFLASVLSRFDGLVAIGFLLVSAVVWGKWEQVAGFKHALTWLVPPTIKLGNIHEWSIGVNAMGSLAELPFPTRWVVWNAGYGLACVLLGLVMLRRIPLTKA
jgi:hypothetical protein